MTISQKLLLTLLFTLILSSSQAQFLWKQDYRTMDSLSYSAYLAQDWQKVITIGQKALDRNIDYYYLRMRMGIAYASLGNYLQAAKQYESALVLNQNDPTAQTYLYQTYQYIGKKNKAYRLSTHFNNTTELQVKPVVHDVESFFLGGGLSMTDNQTRNGSLYLPGNDSLLGKQVLFGNKQILYTGFQFNLSPITSLYVGLNYLSIEKQTRIQYFNYDPDPVTEVTSTGFTRTLNMDKTMFQKTFENELHQTELYLNLRSQFESGWAGSLFANFLMVNTDAIRMDTSETIYTDTLSYNYTTGAITMKDTTIYSFRFRQHDTTFVNYVIGFHLEKDYNQSTFGFTFTSSALNGLKQNQLTLNGFYYLNSMGSFWGSTEGSWFIQKWPTGNENRFFVTQTLGHQLYKLSWVEGEFTLGNMNNASAASGMVVYNQADKMKYKAGIRLSTILAGKFEFSLRYQTVAYDGYIEQNFSDDDNYKTTTFAYQVNNFIGGLKWTF